MPHDDLLSFLKTKNDISAEKYDGSYELVQKTVELLAKQDLNTLNVDDLDMLYFMTVHTKKSSFEDKKQRVHASHLHDENKVNLLYFIDTVQGKVKNNGYKTTPKLLQNGLAQDNAGENGYINSSTGNLGMFGSAFKTLKLFKTTDVDARDFLKMCIKIFFEKDENRMFEIAENTLKTRRKGIGIAVVSQILHCIQPTVFPVINSAVSEMGKLHLQLKNPKDVTQYVKNTKIIQKFRDEKLPFKNYIILDRALFELHHNKIEDETEQMGDDKSRSAMTEIQNNQSAMPLNQILYGPPGTGKTHKLIKEYFPKFIDSDGTKLYTFITFHQAYSYEEFIEGIRPTIDENTREVRYEVKPGIFKTMVQEAMKNPDKNYAIFIDEINRGNIAKIFGELITLLEDDKRIGGKNELHVKLPYSNELFAVPSNLYVIGTMNTADRSIALIDIALRRRFTFVPIYPDYSVENLQYKELLQKLNEKIIEKNGPDYQIGHSYFLQNGERFDLEDVMNRKIIPLLQEYFYNDIDTIAEILNHCGILIIEEQKKLGRIVFKSNALPHE